MAMARIYIWGQNSGSAVKESDIREKIIRINQDIVI